MDYTQHTRCHEMLSKLLQRQTKSEICAAQKQTYSLFRHKPLHFIIIVHRYFTIIWTDTAQFNKYYYMEYSRKR